MGEAEKEASPVKHRWGRGIWRWTRRLGCLVSILIVLAAAVLVAYVATVNHIGEKARQDILAELRERGLPTTPEEFRGEKAPVTPDELEAMTEGQFIEYIVADSEADSVSGPPAGLPFLMAACELAGEPDSWRLEIPYVGTGDGPSLGAPVAADLAECIREYVGQRTELRALLKRAHELLLATPVSGQDVEIEPETLAQHLREVSRELAVVSLNHQSMGRGDAALEACIMGFDFLRALDSALPVNVIRHAIYYFLQDATEQALSRTHPTRPATSRLKEAVVSELALIGSERQVRQEIAYAAEQLRDAERFIAREAQKLPFVERAIAITHRLAHDNTGSALAKVRRHAAIAQAWNAICPGAYRMFLADRLRLWLKVYDTCALPAHEQITRVKGMLAEYASESTEAGYLRGVLAQFEAQARLSVMATALAAEAYRLEHGFWPEVLGLIEEAPTSDPFTGSELRYARTPVGRIIYSVGENLVDDGGECDWETTDDIAFRLFDPDKRAVSP